MLFGHSENLDRLFDAIGCIGSWHVDFRGDRVQHTGRFASLYGLTSAEASDGIPLAMIDRVFHPDDIDDIRRSRRGPFAVKGGRRVMQFRIVDADGQVRWLETHGQIVSDRYGLVHGKGIAFDLTAVREGGEGDHPPTASLAGLDAMSANLLWCYRNAKDLQLSSIEAELKPLLTRVLHLLGRTFRATLLH